MAQRAGLCGAVNIGGTAIAELEVSAALQLPPQREESGRPRRGAGSGARASAVRPGRRQFCGVRSHVERCQRAAERP
jgi:hypothetical protein